MKLETALALGRVSNLPTVWTNALAGFLLARGEAWGELGLALLSVTFLYVGGMYLNDAFDAAWDRKMRGDRPIARGLVAVETVYFWGFVLLLLGLAPLLFSARARSALAFALALAFAILLYDRFHKGFAHAPWLMGLCRALVYPLAGAVAGAPFAPLLLAAGLSALLHTAGITYAARTEQDSSIAVFRILPFFGPPFLFFLALSFAQPLLLPFLAAYALALAFALHVLRSRVSLGVGVLIAALSLLDGTLMATASPTFALLGPLLFLLTLVLQRKVAGT